MPKADPAGAVLSCLDRATREIATARRLLAKPEEDAVVVLVAAFLAERTSLGADAATPARAFYDAFRRFAAGRDAAPCSEVRFARAMRQLHGASRAATADGRNFNAYRGIQLISEVRR